MITSVDQLGPDYRRQLEQVKSELQRTYAKQFIAVFDPGLGTFILVSDDKSISQPFYPQETNIAYYPAYQPNQSEAAIPTTYGSEGYGVLRIEHIGLPDGYYPTTRLSGLFGTSTSTGVYQIDQNLLSQYPESIRNSILYGYDYLPNNQTQSQGNALPFLVYPNQRVVQVELPMGGPLKIGYSINVQNIISTPFGDFGYQTPWDGTSSGGQAIIDPQPGLLHTIRIRWSKIEQLQNESTRPAPPQTQPEPIVLNPKPYVPPKVEILPSNGLRPEFIPSTMPQSPVGGPLPNPSVQLVRPFIDPVNTFRARSVAEMYSYSPNARSYEWIYEVGRKPNITPLQYKFRNNTVNAILRFQFDLPDWVEMSSSKVIDMEPQSEIVITFQFKESDAKIKSTMNSRSFVEQLKWTVVPLNVRGPIYVLRSLSQLITTNPQAKQDPQLNLNQSELTLQLDTNTELTLDSTSVIYAKINPVRSSMVLGESMPIQFTLWIGPPNIEPNTVNSKQLLFPTNGVVWKSLNENVVGIESPNGSINATLTAINSGIADITAEVVLPPTNIPLLLWQSAYKNGVFGINVRTQKTANNLQGIFAAGNVRVVNSRSQLR